MSGTAHIDRKRLATAQARAALRGMVLQQIEGDRAEPLFVVSFHALTRVFGDLDEVEAWLDRVGGKAA